MKHLTRQDTDFVPSAAVSVSVRLSTSVSPRFFSLLGSPCYITSLPIKFVPSHPAITIGSTDASSHLSILLYHHLNKLNRVIMVDSKDNKPAADQPAVSAPSEVSALPKMLSSNERSSSSSSRMIPLVSVSPPSPVALEVWHHKHPKHPHKPLKREPKLPPKPPSKSPKPSTLPVTQPPHELQAYSTPWLSPQRTRAPTLPPRTRVNIGTSTNRHFTSEDTLQSLSRLFTSESTSQSLNRHFM